MAQKRRTPQVIVQTPEPTEGASIYVFELVKALEQAAVPVTLLCPANFDYLAELAAARVPVVLSPARPVSLASFAERLRRNILWVAQTAAVQFKTTHAGDIIHFEHLLHLPLGFVFLLLARLKRVKIVLKVHDPVPHKWRLPARLRWLERKEIKWAYGLCHEIVVHNQVGKSILMSQFQYPESRITVIPHGPLAPEPRGAAFPEMNVLRLLLFGSMRENKGTHLAIEAVQKLNVSHHGRVQLTIAGPVTAAHVDYWTHCKALIARDPAGIEVLERYIADDELPALFARHHAVLMPYVDFFSESGVAALALSNERALIATGAGGLAELLEDSQGGILITAPTVDAIQDAIEQAFALGYEKLRETGLAGAEYLRDARSWKTIAEKTKQVYAALSGGAKPLPAEQKVPV